MCETNQMSMKTFTSCTLTLILITYNDKGCMTCGEKKEPNTTDTLGPCK